MIEDHVCDLCKKVGLTNPSDCLSCIELHVAYAASMGLPNPLQTYKVSCSYSVSEESTIEFPLYKTWGDVEEYYVKWSVLNYKLRGETNWREIHLEGQIDWGDKKRPHSTSIYNDDYSSEVAHQDD